MGKTFLDDLGETITRTTKDLSKKAGKIYEAQKLQSRISGEERMIEKIKGDIGSLIYSRYKENTELDDELLVLCEEIDQHLAAIRGYKDEMADLKGRKICPSCGKSVDRDAAFCSYCGTACPNPEPVKEEPAAEEPCTECEGESAAAPETEACTEESAAAPETEVCTEGSTCPGTDSCTEAPSSDETIPCDNSEQTCE